jgi:CMP-N,N'-diacetyllegionaminic acid synthase
MKILIPARRGSSRIKNKNLQMVGASTLISRTVDWAVNEGTPRKNIFIYTDYRIHELPLEVQDLHCPRPESTCKNDSNADSYITEFCNSYCKKEEIVCLLQPTTPFREPGYLNRALTVYNNRKDGRMTLLASGTDFRESLWELKDSKYQSVFASEPRLQQLKVKRYREDGCIYLFNSTEYINQGSMTKMEWIFIDNKYPFNLDINEKHDLLLAELISSNYK